MTMRPRFTLFDTKVGRRLLAVFLLSAMGPIVVLSLVASRNVSRHLEQQSHERLERRAKSTGMGIHQRLQIAAVLLATRAREIADLDAEGIGAALPIPPVISQLTVTPWNDPRSRLTRAEISRLDEGRPVLGVGDDHSGPTVRIGVPVPGHQLVLWGTLIPRFVWGLSEGPADLGTATLCILDPAGRPLHCPSSDPAVVRQASASGREGPLQWTTSAGLQYGGAWDLFLGYEFGHDSWRVVVGEDGDVIREPIAAFTSTYFAIVALAACLVIALAAWLIRLTLVPLRQLQEATVQLAHHRMDHRVAITARDDDEFKDLADSFNTMASRLEHHMATLTALNAFDREILSTVDRDHIANVVLSHGAGLVEADLLAFALCRVDVADPEWDLTWQMPSHGMSGTSGLRLDVAVRQAIEEREMGAAADPDLVAALMSGSAAWQPVGATWVFPLFQDGRLFGLLALGYHRPTELDEAARRMMRHLIDQSAVAITNIRLVEELGLLQRGALEALARTIDAKSPWTAGHSERVTTLAVAIGKALDLSTEDLERLYRGGLLHDIGKIGIPLGILDKPGWLTEEERAIIETHPGLGARILAPIGPLADVLAIVRHHHERWDGAGYPDRLSGRAIPRLARVLAVADVYDALTSSRPYREGMPHRRVVEIIREGRGTGFDPEVVDAFVSLASESMPDLNHIARWTPEEGTPRPGRCETVAPSELEVIT